MQKQAIKKLKSRKDDLVRLWTNQLSQLGTMDSVTEEGESQELLSLFLEALSDKSIADPEHPSFDAVKDLLTGISISRGKRGFTPRENAQYLLALKQSVLKLLSEDIANTAELYEVNLAISNIIDNLMIMTFESFMKGREDVINRQTDEINEISTPVIRVWDGVVALPIIGTLDSARTQTVMENLLQQIVDTGSSIAILDISGVPAVDSLVAQHLIKTVSATRLMGAECIISGIRPEIAQTVVHLGIDLTGILTKATLASALRTAFTMLQLEVNKKKVAV